MPPMVTTSSPFFISSINFLVSFCFFCCGRIMKKYMIKIIDPNRNTWPRIPLLPIEAWAKMNEYIAYFLTGPDAAPPADLGVTLPLMLRRVTVGLVFAWIVTVGDCAPDFAAELNTTFTNPVSPG